MELRDILPLKVQWLLPSCCYLNALEMMYTSKCEQHKNSEGKGYEDKWYSISLIC